MVQQYEHAKHEYLPPQSMDNKKSSSFALDKILISDYYGFSAFGEAVGWNLEHVIFHSHSFIEAYYLKHGQEKRDMRGQLMRGMKRKHNKTQQET